MQEGSDRVQNEVERVCENERRDKKTDEEENEEDVTRMKDQLRQR